MYIILHVTFLLFLSDFNVAGNFFRHIFEKCSNIKFMTICTVGAQLFHADGQTHTTKLIVAFRSFANPPKNDEEAEFSWTVTEFSPFLKLI